MQGVMGTGKSVILFHRTLKHNVICRIWIKNRSCYPQILTFQIPVFDSLTLLLMLLTTASYSVAGRKGGTILTTDSFLVIQFTQRVREIGERQREERGIRNRNDDWKWKQKKGQRYRQDPSSAPWVTMNLPLSMTFRFTHILFSGLKSKMPS